MSPKEMGEWIARALIVWAFLHFLINIIIKLCLIH
jgi:hypothetical protein